MNEQNKCILCLGKNLCTIKNCNCPCHTVSERVEEKKCPIPCNDAFGKCPLSLPQDKEWEKNKCSECENQATKRLYPTGKYVCDIHAGMSEEEYDFINKVYPPSPVSQDESWGELKQKILDVFSDYSISCSTLDLEDIETLIQSQILQAEERTNERIRKVLCKDCCNKTKNLL